MKTNDMERNYMLRVLNYVWEKNPHLRFGQLLVNVVNPSTPCPEIFYIEDADLAQDLMRKFGGDEKSPPVGFTV